MTNKPVMLDEKALQIAKDYTKSRAELTNNDYNLIVEDAITAYLQAAEDRMIEELNPEVLWQAVLNREPKSKHPGQAIIDAIIRDMGASEITATGVKLPESATRKDAEAEAPTKCDHQWDNVMVTDDREEYLCSKCMAESLSARK